VWSFCATRIFGQSEVVALFAVLYFVLFIFWLLLISRVIVEFIRSFARDWRPSGFVVVILELIFTITDPPVKLLRRLIPPVSLGGIRLDLSIMVLLFIVFILMSIVGRLGQPVAPV
jgi:YggT family protein